MSWLLDADVLSQPAKQHRDARVVAWLYQEREHCYTSSIVIAQLAYWVRTKQGRQREALQEWLTRLIEAMEGRIRGFNVSVAKVWADLQASTRRSGSTDAHRGQLHCGDSPAIRANYCHRQRPAFPTTRSEDLQSIQGTSANLNFRCLSGKFRPGECQWMPLAGREIANLGAAVHTLRAGQKLFEIFI
jgi:predicted nucleic acid-binding protein